MNGLVGRLLYGLLFCAALPAWLILWARLTNHLVPIPLVGEVPRWIGIVLTVTGLFLQLASMVELWRRGRGLPMNAFPPERFVTSGPYRWVSHPIYAGFMFCCAGVSLACHSASGFFLVTPVVILLCITLVVGYEWPAIKARWGDEIDHHTPLLGPPANVPDRANYFQRLIVCHIVFIPWILLYYMLIYLGDSPDFVVIYLPGEEDWPVLEWTEFFYSMTYPFVLLAPLVLQRKDHLRWFTHLGWWLIACGIFLQFVLPCHAPPRPAETDSLLGKLLVWERGLDGPACALPSFHVMWALAAAQAWSLTFPRWKAVFWILALCMSISCITVGNHTVTDVLAGFLVYVAIAHRANVWLRLRRWCEKLGNSWHAWQFGPLRIINHSLYAGLAAVVGILLCGQFIRNDWHLLLLAFCILVSAGLWGQWVTGSSKLQRPFGYYGAILGALLAVVILMLGFGYHFVPLCAIAALAAPWVQALGRLRCLVQGCCHGKPTSEEWGIRCTNPHSRVYLISALRDMPIHITPLYSIVSNLAAGLFLWRLWYTGHSPALLAGLYGILNGAFRFMEEAYRGEVQTPVWGGLRLYQWLAILSIVAGMAFTCLPGPTRLYAEWRLDGSLIATSLTSGILAAFLMGMDFPQSQRRFARLSG